MSKLRIKIGDVEIEFDGSEDFLKAEVPLLLEAAMDLAKAAPAKPAAQPSGGGAGAPIPLLNSLSMTTATIAAKISVTTGSDLFLAAGAQLTLVAKKDTFTRQEALTQMKSATSYYKTTYSNNLTASIKKLIEDGNLVENATNVFALTPKARADLGEKLANP